MGKDLDEAMASLNEKTKAKKIEFLELVCDLCHKPYSLMQEQLEEACSCCPVPRMLDELIAIQNSKAAAELMKIVKEEMLRGKSA